MQLTLEEAMTAAVAHHQAGRLAEAEQLYRQILARQPRHAPALHLLGLIAWHAKQIPQAEELIRQAIAITPQEPTFLNNLSIILLNSGRPDEAIAILQRITEIAPQDPAAHFTLGAALRGRDPAQAEASYRRVVELHPDHAGALNNLGLLLKARGRLEEAVALFQRALLAKNDYMEALGNLADLYFELRNYQDAAACSAKAADLQPGQPLLHSRLAASLLELGRVEESIAACRRGLNLHPAYVPLWNDLGSALNLAGRLDEAEAAYREALRLNPQLAEVMCNLAVLLESRGEIDAAIALYRQAVALRPDLARIHSNLLYTLHFSSAYDAKAILGEHLKWDAVHAAPLRDSIQPHTNVRDPNRRLRIGYVSPDFYNNVIGRFMLPLLTSHNRKEVEVFCYSAGRVKDTLAEQLQKNADVWRTIGRMGDEDAAAKIRDDNIDVLVDLTMHMRNSRLLVFARKPAPVQMTYLAFCSTTGLAAMDYRISDSYMDPPESDTSCYSEKTLRLPDCYWCYDTPPDAPPVNELPALSGRGVTFGCLNSFSKVSPEALETWSRILLAVPNSKLRLHAKAGSHRERVFNFLENRGVKRERCEFIGPLQTADYFKLYQRIDIALDPFPYAGGTTTCDALWMGVPVVTLGQSKLAVGRGGVSILSNINEQQLITANPNDYVQRAAELAADLNRLAELRRTLRDRMHQSPLMDAPRFARAMESLFREAWQNWCRTTAR